MQWWIRPGPSRSCAITKPMPSATEEVRHRHAAVLVADLGVVVVVVAHHRDAALDAEAGRVGGHDDLAEAEVGVRVVGVRHRHHDGERRPVRAAGEPLVPVDDPVVAVAHRRGAQQLRVGAGHLGLGHGEAAADLPVDERPQPARLLLVGAVAPEDLGVARSRAPASRRRPARAGCVPGSRSPGRST